MKIPRLARSLQTAAVLTVAVASAVRAQEVRPDSATRPDTATRADSTTHNVKRGDTLWDLANAYLGDAYLWPEIYRLNTDQIEDPHWIYPGEHLRLPGRAAAAPTAVAAAPSPEMAGSPMSPPPVRAPAVEEPPRRVSGPTVFRVYAHQSSARDLSTPPRPPRVPFGDVLRAPYFDRNNGPRGTGVVLVGADIPGIESPAQTANFQLYDKVLMTPPAGSVASEGERFMAYDIGDDVEGVGSVVVPSALLRVVHPPRSGTAAVAEVLELYGALNANTRLIPFDTAGAGANGLPIPVSRESAKTGKVRWIYRPVVLPSLNYYILCDLKAADGLRIGDEIQVFRPRQNLEGGDGPAAPEVAVATAQIVKVTAYGSTARITSQDQPAIRIGQRVRVTARMP